MFDRIKKWLPFKRGDQAARRVGTPDPESVHPLARIEQDLNQLMGRLGSLGSLGSLWPTGADWRSDSWFGDFSAAAFTPTLDLADKRKHLEVTLELPGMDADDIELDVRDNALVIRGQKREEETSEDEGFYRTERSFGAFERVVPLPTEVEEDGTEATFRNGVLKVRLPKARPETTARRIPIKGS